MIVFWLAVSLLCCHAPHLWMPIRYFGVDGKGRLPVGENDMIPDTLIGYDSICPFIVRAQQLNATLKLNLALKNKHPERKAVFQPSCFFSGCMICDMVICQLYFLCSCFLPKFGISLTNKWLVKMLGIPWTVPGLRVLFVHLIPSSNFLNGKLPTWSTITW